MDFLLGKKKIQLLIFILLGLSAFSVRAEEELVVPEENISDEAISKATEGIEDQLQKDVDFESTRLKIPEKKWVTPQTVDYGKVLSAEVYGDMVAVQKNFMPKTDRWQGSIGASWLTNDNFYWNFGIEGRGGYHFTETYGLEFVSSFHSSTETYKVTDLRDRQNISATSLVTPKSFIGLALFFNPIYGKWAVKDRSISAFDIYQTLGFGKLKTSSDTDADAIFLGLGQMTSISRNQFWRADLSFYFYRTKSVVGQEENFNSLFLTVSWGGFLPRVGNRQ